MPRDKVCIQAGKASSGQTKPAEKTIGREEKSMTGVAISREAKRDPRKSPNAREAERKAKPKVRRSLMLPSFVTSKSSKL